MCVCVCVCVFVLFSNFQAQNIRILLLAKFVKKKRNKIKEKSFSRIPATSYCYTAKNYRKISLLEKWFGLRGREGGRVGIISPAMRRRLKARRLIRQNRRFLLINFPKVKIYSARSRSRDASANKSVGYSAKDSDSTSRGSVFHRHEHK